MTKGNVVRVASKFTKTMAIMNTLYVVRRYLLEKNTNKRKELRKRLEKKINMQYKAIRRSCTQFDFGSSETVRILEKFIYFYVLHFLKLNNANRRISDIFLLYLNR